MKERTIEQLGYLLRQAKKSNRPQPIFFLGAGASRSGNIPLASEIVQDIITKYSDSPILGALKEEDRTYARLMECFSASQRGEILKQYINNAKINVTHIYLAQLISEGFVDYVLTVNFDNLMLRALSLYNFFPPTHDLAILRDFTTSTFKEKSVIYLHGQSHGLWLLNTSAEMEKVKSTVPRIFDTIKNQRPWIFIGYSGEDPIFEHIKNLGRFDDELYWVTYNNNDPNQHVQEFLSDPNSNAFIIKGYDADSFMLKLSNELGLPQPVIVDKPFTALKNMLEEIVDIDEKEHFKGVKERLEISKRQVAESIKQFEEGNVETAEDNSKKRSDILKKEIINLLVSEKYAQEVVSEIEKRLKENPDQDAFDLLANLYYNWGCDLGDLANTQEGKAAEELYLQAIEKYKKAVEIKPDYYKAHNNWGTSLGNLAMAKEGKEAYELHLQAFEKFKKAIDLNPNYHQAYYNWGTYLGEMAQIKEGKEAEVLYLQSFEKLKKTIEIKPDSDEAYYNWGTSLGNLAMAKEGKEAENLYLQSFEKFKKSVEIKPAKYEPYNNWGIYLGKLAKEKEGKEAEVLYLQAFEKFKKSVEIKPDSYEVYYNWGIYLGKLAKEKEGKEAEKFHLQAFEKLKKVIEINPDDHKAYFNWGTYLGNLAKTKGGKEAEELYLQAFEKYKKAIEIKPDYQDTYYNWGGNLMEQAKTKEGKEAEELYLQAHEKLFKAVELGGGYYNLACFYAIRGNDKEALHYLALSLSKSEISTGFVEKDLDWKGFLNNDEFIEILKRYK
ncbi:MAG: SIR2 family protein [Saprospiraceae bacterium]|nr:SIR2 family protein [Saprospiraceae bacterium]